ncbi:MAG: PHP domain-containing protein [Treponema sp.]|jgi:predicted metal-dependent phosphoesterase TrpH|nr:PHP domain-containing protein [Treponema sp.]
MIDLHTHSSASDGSLSPGALIGEAAAQGLTAIALTDHDTVQGLEEAKKAAKAGGIVFIPGIELEIIWSRKNEGGEFHLLGLGLRRLTPSFTEAVAELSRRRERRNLEILDRMHELSIEADYRDIQALSGGHSVGRPHFAALLVNRGIVKTREQAFSRYLARGKPLYMPKKGLEFDEAVGAIKSAGGIAVLAHPMSLYLAWGRLPEVVKNLKDRGLDGIEAWHPTAKVRSCKRLDALGKNLGLYITEGSDYHGEARPGRRLGITAGGRKIEDSVLEALPDLAAR